MEIIVVLSSRSRLQVLMLRRAKEIQKQRETFSPMLKKERVDIRLNKIGPRLHLGFSIWVVLVFII